MKMPASGGDPVSTTLRLAFSPASKNGDLDCGLEASAKRALLTRIEYEPANNYQLSVLNSLKSKYIVVYTKPNKNANGTNVNNKKSTNITLPVPKLTLFPPERVQLGYRGNLSVGSGMSNMGNTCYLNSILQALFHVPALVNWLVSETAHQNCVQNSDYQMHPDDITCSVIKTFKCSQQKTGNCMKPISVYSKLKAICKHLSHGSQEDAHEFMRYLLESLEKNYLTRFQGHKLDSTSKETTPINQIFGGYIRTEVVCLSCRAVSTTFQHFQDLPLDIRKASTLNDALAGYFERERLPDGEDAYKCEKCNRKVSVTKKFTIEKPPNVLCIQLKRFSMTNGKITKQVQLSQYLDITRFISSNIQPRHPVKYKLVSMVTHMGQSVNCGHYTAIALAANGSYYQFDDSSVRQIPLSTVLSMSAYLILYEMERPFQTVNPRPFSAPSSTASWTENSNGGTEDDETWSPTESATNSNSVNSLSNDESKREGADSQSRMVYQLNKHGKVYAAPPICPTRESPSPNIHHHNHHSLQQQQQQQQQLQLQQSPQNKKGSKTPLDPNSKRSSLVPYESDVSTDSDVENKDRSELEKLLTKLSSSSSPTTSAPSSSSSPSAKGWKVTEQHDSGMTTTTATSKTSGTPGWSVTEVKTSPERLGRNLSDTELNGRKKKKIRGSGSDSEIEKSLPNFPDSKKKRTSILEKYKCNFGKMADGNGSKCSKPEDSKESKESRRDSEKTASEDTFSDSREERSGSSSSTAAGAATGTFIREPQRSVLGHGGTNGYSNGKYSERMKSPMEDGRHSHEKTSDKYENGKDSPRKSDQDLSAGDVIDRDFQKKRNIVNSLIQNSHWGYGNSNVKSWKGTQSALEREINEEKCEGTKRNYSDLYNEEFDRGKVKKLKTHKDRDRPRYNLFQRKQQKYQEKMNYYHWRGNNRNHGRYGNDFRNPFKRQPFNDQFNGNHNWNYSKKNYKFF